MPHFIIEYSSNLDDEIKIQKLFSTLHDAALETGLFPLSSIIFRAVRCEKYLIADGDPENAFVHMTLRLRYGRDIETRKVVGELLFKALTDYFKLHFSRYPLNVSFEIVELHEELSFKENSIHRHIRQKQN